MTDVCAEVCVWNENVDEMIRLLCRLQAAKITTRDESAGHAARLEILRAELNADFRDVITLRETINSIRNL
jgi:hypothetical protein